MAGSWGNDGGPTDRHSDLTVSSVIRRTRAVSVVLLAVVELLAATTHLLGHQGTVAGSAVSAGLAAWAVLRLATARPARWWPLPDVAVAAGYVLATPTLVDGPEFVAVGTPMLAVGGTAVVAIAIACRPLRSLPATAVIVGCWALGAACVPGVGNPLTIFNLDFIVVEWAMAATLYKLTTRAARTADIGQAELAEAEKTERLARARRVADHEAWATMHDTAASTLTMLARGAHVRPSVLREELRRDLDVLERANTSGGNPTIELAGALTKLAGKLRTPASYVGPASMHVPSVIGGPIADAARQVLVNVDHHAHAQQVKIELTDGLLTVSDDGIGFDLTDDTVIESRHGVRFSIQRRLTNLGVAVAIRSSPGSGTAVEIDWRSTHAVAASAPGIDHSERLLDRYGYGLLFAAILITATQCRFGLTAAHPFGQLLIVAVAVAITGVAVLESRGRVARTLWWSAMAGAVIAGPVQILLLDPADLTAGANWAVGALGWQVAALACRRPVKAGMTVLAALWIGGVLAVIGHSQDIESSSAWVYTVISVASLQGLAIWFGGVLRKTVRDSQTTMAAVAEVNTAAAVGEALHHDNLRRARQLSSELVPLLTRLLSADSPARDPALRAECLIESARLRRMFDPIEFAGNPLVEELTAAISAAEQRGVSVDRLVVGDIPDLDASQRSRILTAPLILLEGARTRARVVVTGNTGHTDLPTVSITVDCSVDTGTAAQAVTPAGSVLFADGLVWATVPLA